MVKEGHTEKSSSDNGSYNAQELIENRVKFKLYAAEHHLKNLKALEKGNESMLHFEGRIKWEVEIECFLSQLVGVRDAILVRINDKMGLKLKSKEAILRNIQIILNALGKTNLLERLKIFERSNWFLALNKLRNDSMHRKLINVHIKAGTSEAKVYLITDSQTELEVIPYLNDNLQKMKEMIEDIKNIEPILSV